MWDSENKFWPRKKLTEIVKMMIRGQSQNGSQMAAFRELPVQAWAGQNKSISKREGNRLDE